MDLIEELVERNKKGLADIYGRSYKKVYTNSRKSVLKKKERFTPTLRKKVYTKNKKVHTNSQKSVLKKRKGYSKKSVHQKERCTPTLKSQFYSDLTQYVS